MAPPTAGSCCASLARRLLTLIEQETGLQLGDHNAWLLKAQAAQASSGDLAAALTAPAVPGLVCTMQFAHTCRHTACADAACALCKNNPNKACAQHLRPKYVVGQAIAAPCGAPLRLALDGGAAPAGAAARCATLRASGARVQLLLVDERARQQRAKQLLLTGASSASNQQVAVLLRETTVAFDPAGKPMLSCTGCKAERDGSLMLQLGEDAGNGVTVAGLSVGCSTERATSGRKRAPVRLAALLVDSTGQPMDTAPLLSSEFYVVSDRAENHEGHAWLLKDSPVSAVRTIGKETVRRLSDLRAACESSGVALKLPDGLTSVTTVRELARLLRELRGQQTALSQVLKISKAQLEAAAVHVATAVDPDSHLRAYLPAGGAAGLVFTCRQGGCEYAEPAVVVRFRRAAGGAVEIVALQQLGKPIAVEAERSAALCALWSQAEAAWTAPRHEGWQVLELGGQRFTSFSELEAALPPSAQQPVVPHLPAQPAATQVHVAAVPPAPAAVQQQQQQQQQQQPQPQPLQVLVAPQQHPQQQHQQHQQHQQRQHPHQHPHQQQQRQPSTQVLPPAPPPPLAPGLAAPGQPGIAKAAQDSLNQQLQALLSQTLPPLAPLASLEWSPSLAGLSQTLSQAEISSMQPALPPAPPSDESQALRNLAAQILNNPLLLATAAATAAAAAADTAPGGGAPGGGDSLKRNHSSCSGGDEAAARVVRPRASSGILALDRQESALSPAEYRSLDSTTLPSIHLGHSGHLPPLPPQQHALQQAQQQAQQQAPAPALAYLATQHAQQQSQLQAFQRLSMPRPPVEPVKQQDQKQAELFDLLYRLSQGQTAGGSSAAGSGSGGRVNHPQAAPPAQPAVAAPPNASVRSVPLDFWTPRLEQLASVFSVDGSKRPSPF